jgi:AcrR family transcriptional regulator
MAKSPAFSSPREQERPARILQAAETMLAQDGEHGLQMKHLARRAGVALATLYIDYPSKDHVLAAIALDRHVRALQHVDTMTFDGETPGERAADLMLREFRRMQRDPEMATALQRVSNAPDRANCEYVEGIAQIVEELVLHAVTRGDGEAKVEHQAVLPIFVSAANGAISKWLGGMLSAEQTRTRIRAAARLFDLPADVVREYLV